MYCVYTGQSVVMVRSSFGTVGPKHPSGGGMQLIAWGNYTLCNERHNRSEFRWERIYCGHVVVENMYEDVVLYIILK